MPWYTEGEKTNPAADTILADTGQIGFTLSSFNFIVSAGVSCRVKVQHRNSANDTTIKEQILHLDATSPVAFAAPNSIALSENDRLRILVDSAITVGKIQGSIFIS